MQILQGHYGTVWDSIYIFINPESVSSLCAYEMLALNHLRNANSFFANKFSFEK
jgi:hypothetical protein